MNRIAKREIKYRTPEQEKNFSDGDRSMGYTTIFPGEEVPQELVPSIVSGNPHWLEPVIEEKKDSKGKTKKVKKTGHGLNEKELYKLNKAEQIELLREHKIVGDELDKLIKSKEKSRVTKLLELK